VAQRGRAFALIVAAAFAGACGDDSGDDDDKKPVDGGKADAARPDAATDAGGGMDAGRDSGTDAGRDSGTPDAGPPAVEGTDAPTLTKVGFYKDDSVFRILIAGSDKNGDIASYTVAFFSDVAGTISIPVNLSGDSTAEGSLTFTANITHNPAYQDFFTKFEPSAEFDGVMSIRVTVKDAGGRTSTEKLEKRGPTPPASGTCDPNGFNKCSANSLCAPASNGNYSCASIPSARQQACSANSVLALTAPGSVTGTLNNASFWDAPTGCVGTTMQVDLADRVVKVHLDAVAPKLTLAPADTAWDMGIYQLPTATPACGMNPAACGDNGCLACSDTGPSGPLVLTNVPAGDHFFVVERFPPDKTGDTFTLTATVGN
jgi:hypothetical protein